MNDLAKWKALKKQIDYYNRQYRLGFNMVDDQYYDHLLDNFKQLEVKLQIEKSTIKDPVTGSKVKHIFPMLSLDHGFGVGALEGFASKVGFPIVMEHKIDGLSLAIRYVDNKLNKILTRGNGKVGTDVTGRLQALKVPIHIPYPGIVEIRGELYTTFKEFEKLAGEFTSPRNYCAAFLHTKSGEPLIQLFFAAYECIGVTFDNYLELLAKMEEIGFQAVWNQTVHDLPALQQKYTEVYGNRSNVEYPFDGVVLKVNSMEQRERLGTHLTAPRWAFAVKRESVRKVTTIVDIIISVGKFGKITPVAIVEPIEIGGFTIQRVSLHNTNEILKHNYGKSDLIQIEHVGDCVPQVVGKIYDANNPIIIQKCPSCCLELIQVNDNLFCKNSWNCPDQQIARIAHFCGRNAANIEGIAKNKIKQLVRHGLIQTPIDLFRLNSNDLLGLQGWDKKSANKMIHNINRARSITLSSLLNALCIANLGTGASASLGSSCKNFSTFLEIATEEMHSNIKNIGHVTMQSVQNFIKDNKWVYEIPKYMSIS